VHRRNVRLTIAVTNEANMAEADGAITFEASAPPNFTRAMEPTLSWNQLRSLTPRCEFEATPGEPGF